MIYRRFLMLTCCCLAPALADAADLAPYRPTAVAVPAKPAWTVDLGVGALALPRYPGSEDFRVIPIPYIAINYKDIVFASPKEGVGINVLNVGGFQAGPVLKYAPGRYRSDSRRYLTGLDKVDGTVEAGGFIRYTIDPIFSAKLEVRNGIGGHEGLIAELSADVNGKLADHWFFSVGPRLSYTNSDYNEAYYGVTPLESVRSGYRAYRPGSGFHSVGAGLGTAYNLTDKITLGAYAEYSRLLDDAARSPIVRGPGGSRDQFVIGSAVTYRFTFN